MTPLPDMHTPEGELSIHVDMVEVTDMGPRPDKSWEYTDKQGHEHFYDGYPVPYPTLVDVPDGVYYCQDCRDEHDESHTECRICGEHITPGMTGGDMFRQYIPGRRQFMLDGAEITEARFMELLNRYVRPQVS